MHRRQFLQLSVISGISLTPILSSGGAAGGAATSTGAVACCF